MLSKLSELVNHSAKEYAKRTAGGEKVTTNTVEGYFSILKRDVHGTYHHIRRTVRQGSATVTPMTVDEDLVKAKDLLNEARRLLVEEKTEECLGLLDGALARVDRVISQLAQREQPK